MASSSDRRRERVSGRTRAEQHEVSGSSTCYRVPEGLSVWEPIKSACKRIFDIIPFVAGARNPWAAPGKTHYERTYFVHRGIGVESSSYCCLAKNFGNKCPICEARALFIREGREDEAKELVLKERQLWLVYDHAAPEKGLQLWDYSYHLFGRYLDQVVREAGNEEQEIEYFADPDEGLTLKVYFREDSGRGYKFYKGERIEFLPRGRRNPIPPELFESAPCLDDLLVEFPYDKLKAIFYQTADDEPPVKSRAKAPPPEDEDEPVVKAKTKSKAKAPPPDDDDDDEAEVGEGPPPADLEEMKPGAFVEFKKKECEIRKVLRDGRLEIIDEDSRIYQVRADRVKLIRDQEDEDDEPPVKSKAKAPPPDDDDDDDEPVVKAKTKSKAKAPPPDDDDDDDDDDVPVRTTKRR